MNQYNKYRDKMKSGDIIAFSGKGPTSNLIKWKTNSHISHVGIIAETNVFGSNRVMMCESTTLVDEPDAIDKTLTKGVQMHFLSQRIDGYNGDIYWHPLQDKLEKKYEKSMQQWLSSKHSNKTPYDTMQALGAGLDLLDPYGLDNETDFSSLFCSELVTRALQIAGEVGPHINPSEMTPKDVLTFSCLVETGYKIR